MTGYLETAASPFRGADTNAGASATLIPMAAPANIFQLAAALLGLWTVLAVLPDGFVEIGFRLANVLRAIGARRGRTGQEQPGQHGAQGRLGERFLKWHLSPPKKCDVATLYKGGCCPDVIADVGAATWILLIRMDDILRAWPHRKQLFSRARS